MLRHFIDTQDFTKQELLDMIELARRIKAADQQGCTPKLLQDASLAMIFEEPSTRTRVSFEVAMTELVGTPCTSSQGNPPGRTRDAVRYRQGALAHVRHHHGPHSQARDHPGAGEVRGGARDQRPDRLQPPFPGGVRRADHDRALPYGKNLAELNVTFIGDATNVLSSLMLICTRLGMHFTQAAPQKYQALPNGRPGPAKTAPNRVVAWA